MKISGVALRTPWVMEERRIHHRKQTHKKVIEHNAAMEATTYIQFQNYTQTVKSQRHGCASCHYEHGQACMFSFGQLSTAKHIGYHLWR